MRVHKLAILAIIVVLFTMLTIIIILLQKHPAPLPVYEPEREPIIISRMDPCKYKQTGILTSSESDKEPIILPLFARNVYGRGDRFQYYTMSDKRLMVHLPVQFNNRECEDRNGCDELYNGDKITVTSYENREFTVTIYKRY